MNKFGVMNPRDPNAYRCCICCHVKVGTILYGLFCLMLQIFVLGVVVLVSIHPDILVPPQSQSQSMIGKGPQFDGILVDELQKLEKEDVRAITREDLCMMYAVFLLCIMTTVALLYGVIRSRPGYMVPFFCLHVFDFCLGCLTLVSYFTYAPHFNVKMWIRESGASQMPGMEHLMQVDGDYLMFFTVTMLLLYLCLKAYLISMIWACYKYVQQVVLSRGMLREYQVDPDTEMLLPPRYEDAIKTAANTNQPPPPPYSQ